MKELLTQEELERIKERMKQKGTPLLLSDEEPDKEYMIKFKVTNEVLATYLFLNNMATDNPEFDLGIKITSLGNVSACCNLSEIKSKLHEFIENL